MHPYRKNASDHANNDRHTGRSGDLGLWWMFLIVGLVPVVSAWAHHDVWGIEPSLGTLLAVGAARPLLRHHGRALRAACRSLRRFVADRPGARADGGSGAPGGSATERPALTTMQGRRDGEGEAVVLSVEYEPTRPGGVTRAGDHRDPGPHADSTTRS